MTTGKVALLNGPGDESAFVIEEVPIPSPGKGQVVVRIQYAGVNFMDTQVRSGETKVMPFPLVVGYESAGIVHSVGEGVTGFAVGDKVMSYAWGAYAEYLLADAQRVIKLDAISPKMAASTMINGCTAQYLITQGFPVRHGQVIVVNTAAGGTGGWISQMAHHAGAIIIGTVSSQDKVETAKKLRVDHVIVTHRTEFDGLKAKVAELTNRQGVEVVFDAVGGSMLDVNLALLKPGGTIVNYGKLGGNFELEEAQKVAEQAGKIYKRDGLMGLNSTETLMTLMKPVINLINSGKAVVNIYKQYPLEQVGQAHKDLTSRSTMGKLLLCML